MFLILKLVYWGFSTIETYAFLQQDIFLELSEINSLEKRQYLPHYWSNKGYRCASVRFHSLSKLNKNKNSELRTQLGAVGIKDTILASD